MTRFERDLNEAKNGNEKEVLTRRKKELKKLEEEGKTCKNAFRAQCIAQDYNRLKAEYLKISSLF